MDCIQSPHANGKHCKTVLHILLKGGPSFMSLTSNGASLIIPSLFISADAADYAALQWLMWHKQVQSNL